MSAPRIALATAGAIGVVGAFRAVRARTGDRFDRTNFRGGTVSLAAGPALALAAAGTAAIGAACTRGSDAPALRTRYGAAAPALRTRYGADAPAVRIGYGAAALVAGLGAGAVGCYDDVVGNRPGHQGAKGFRGHLGALRHGRVTSGLVKIAGVGLSGLAAAALLAADDPRPRRRRPVRRVTRAVDLLCGAGVIAGTANLVNLLDLRPGRALKAGLLLAAPLAGDPATATMIAGPVGAAVALLPGDLGEHTMIGDAGANAYGALLGLGLAARTGPTGRAALLVGIAALTAASEKVSFTRVIEATPPLRALDTWGRRP